MKAGHFAAAVQDLGRALDAGFAPEATLSNPLLQPLREDPDRRLELSELVKKYVRADHIQMVDPLEPGKRIRLAGRVVDMATGKALAGALIKLYHTDAGGEYRPGMDAGGGAGNPRLFGYVREFAETRRAGTHTFFAWLAGNLFVGAQVSWNLRPFFVSPGLDVEFLRKHPFDGSFYEAVWQALHNVAPF